MQPDTLWTKAIEARAIHEKLPKRDLPMLFAWLYRRMNLRDQSRAALESEVLQDFSSLFHEFSLWRLDRPLMHGKSKRLSPSTKKCKVRRNRR